MKNSTLRGSWRETSILQYNRAQHFIILILIFLFYFFHLSENKSFSFFLISLISLITAAKIIIYQTMADKQMHGYIINPKKCFRNIENVIGDFKSFVQELFLISFSLSLSHSSRVTLIFLFCFCFPFSFQDFSTIIKISIFPHKVS